MTGATQSSAGIRRRIASRFRVLLFPLLFFVSAFSPAAFLNAQTGIPVGTWRLHLSYNRITSIAAAEGRIYAASESAIVVYDLSDNSLSTINTLNGLTAAGITSIAYDDSRDQLLVGYENGNVDVIRGNSVTGFNRIRNAPEISGSKRINDVAIHGGLAYLSADFGIVVFDLDQLELKETWRDLGEGGASLMIYNTAFLGDSIFAATEQGVIAGNLSTNLPDFNHWRRFDAGSFDAAVSDVENFDEGIVASIDGSGLFHRTSGQWTKLETPELDHADFNSLNAAGNTLLIAEASGLWRLSAGGELERIDNGLITSPAAAISASGKLWIADEKNGLVADVGSGFHSFVPDGPTITRASRLKYLDNRIFALAGGFSSGDEPVGSGTLNFFGNGAWSAEVIPMNDLTDIDLIGGERYLSSFGDGLHRSGNSGTTVFDHDNSPLYNSDPVGKEILISAIEHSEGGLWVLNYGAPLPLHFLKEDSWESFPLVIPFIADLQADQRGRLWMKADPRYGQGVVLFDPADNSSRIFANGAGNGGLPDGRVHALDVDRDGNVWVGTEEGIAYIYSSEEDAVRPIFENRFLLQNEKITAIETDGGNRKWIGTERGAWLFGPSGEELIHNFTTANSPLLSDSILDIEINDGTGEVFFATEKGIVSFRSDATVGDSDFSRLKIFPNPVTPAFTGVVGISGLAVDAIVKITDISGRLIWETQAAGGTATWNLRDYNGKRATRGIYLVFAAKENGSESVVGKIAVVD